MADIRKLLEAEDEFELTDQERLQYHILKAQQHASKALNLCYEPSSVHRSLWYRMVLGRAQSILMSLTVREARGD